MALVLGFRGFTRHFRVPCFVFTNQLHYQLCYPGKSIRPSESSLSKSLQDEQGGPKPRDQGSRLCTHTSSPLPSLRMQLSYYFIQRFAVIVNIQHMPQVTAGVPVADYYRFDAGRGRVLSQGRRSLPHAGNRRPVDGIICFLGRGPENSVRTGEFLTAVQV